MTEDLATRIRRYYESAASPVDPDEAIERHIVRVEESSSRSAPVEWLKGHPAAAVGTAAAMTLLAIGGALLAIRGPSESGPADYTETTTTAPSTLTTEAVVPAIDVTGDSSCIVTDIGAWTGDRLAGGFRTELRGQSLSCTDDTSDPRVNGSWDVALNCDYSVEGDMTVGECWGTMETAGIGGGWRGTFVAATEWSAETQEISHIIDADVLGSDDYDGLRYVYRSEGPLPALGLTGHIGPIDELEGARTTNGS